MIHAGGAVTKGNRYILVGFVSVLPPGTGDPDCTAEPQLSPGWIDEFLLPKIAESNLKDYKALDLHWKSVRPSTHTHGNDS